MIFLLLLLFTPLLAGAEQPAAIVVRPSLYSSVKASQNIRITCVGYGDPTPVISWSRYSGGPLVNGSDSVRIHELNKTVNGTEFAISVLEICSLHVNHTDQYTCVAKNGVQGRGIADDSASFYIFAAPNIQKPPNIVVHPPANSTVPKGSTVEIICVAYGQPLPSIVWSRSDVANLSNLSSSSSNTVAHVYSEVVRYGGIHFLKSILQICDISPEDDNNYQCIASNNVGTNDSITFSLQVKNASVTGDLSTTSIDPSCLPTTTSTSSNSNITFIIALASEGVVFLIVCIVLIVIIIAVYLGAKRNREKQIINARGTGHVYSHDKHHTKSSESTTGSPKSQDHELYYTSMVDTSPNPSYEVTGKKVAVTDPIYEETDIVL